MGDTEAFILRFEEALKRIQEKENIRLSRPEDPSNELIRMELESEIKEILEYMKEGIKLLQEKLTNLGRYEDLEKWKEFESFLSKLSDR